MTQAHRLNKIYSENFFREKKENKGFLSVLSKRAPKIFVYYFGG